MGLFKTNVKKLREKNDAEKLIDALKHKDCDVRKEAAEALGVIGDKRAIEPLIEGLRDEDELVRERIAEALGNIGDTRAIKPLVQTYRHHRRGLDWIVVWAAADALHKLGWKPKDNSGKVRYLINKRKWDEVASLGKPAIGPLLNVLTCEELITMHGAALMVLAERNFKDAVNAVRDSFSSGSRFLDFIRETAETLARMNVIQPLDNHLALGFFGFDMAIAFERSKNSRIIEILKRRMEKGDLRVIAGAYQLAIRLGKPGSEKLLAKALEEGASWPSSIGYINGPSLPSAGLVWQVVMAEDFLNCGNPRLETAAKKWAAKNGFKIAKKAGYGGPKWGEGITMINVEGLRGSRKHKDGDI